MKFKQTAFLAIAVFALFFASISSIAFAQESQKNMTSLVLNGQEYLFSTNLYDAIKIPVNDEAGIKSVFDSFDGVCLIYNESSEKDNAYFSTVLYNLVFKVKRHYTLEGRAFEMIPCNEYNISEIIIPILFIKGPNTGATENSVTLNDTSIILQGTDQTGIQMAGDKLALVVLGITELESYEDKGIPAQSLLVIAVGIVLLIIVIYLVYRESRKKGRGKDSDFQKNETKAESAGEDASKSEEPKKEAKEEEKEAEEKAESENPEKEQQ